MEGWEIDPLSYLISSYNRYRPLGTGEGRDGRGRKTGDVLGPADEGEVFTLTLLDLGDRSSGEGDGDMSVAQCFEEVSRRGAVK